MKTVSPDMKFRRSLGVEYTWLPKKGDNIPYTLADEVESRLTRAGVLFHGCHRDDGALEVSTPIMYNLDEVRKWWVKIHKVLKPFRLLRWRSDLMSGGAHIHVGTQGVRRRNKFLLNAMRDAINKPYLNWVFNHPDDNENASWMGDPELLISYCQKCRWGADTLERLENLVHSPFCVALRTKTTRVPRWLDFPDDKRHAMRYDEPQKTLELRFFDMPRSWREAKAMLLFADRYVAWLEVQTAKTPLIEVRCKPLKKWTLKDCQSAFRLFLRTLDLDPAEYEVFVRRNLRARFIDKKERD